MTDWSCFWPRVCGWRMPAARCGAKTLSESRSTPRCSRRTSAPQPTPSCCTPPSGANRLANKHGVRLRRSYLRIAKRAAMMAGRYGHAKQFNRHRRQLRILRSRLGRLIRDIGRKIAGHEQIEAAFALPLARASQIRGQQQRQRGFKLNSFHAPETECIGKSKASAPYEFGVKVSIVTTNARAPGWSVRAACQGIARQSL
jgi:hypothetical protein